MLQMSFSPTDGLDFSDFSLPAGPSYGYEMSSDPFASSYGEMSQSFATQNTGLWTPNNTTPPVSSRNNSTASSFSIPTPVGTPATVMNASFGNNMNPTFGGFKYDDPFGAGGFGLNDHFCDWTMRTKESDIG